MRNTTYTKTLAKRLIQADEDGVLLTAENRNDARCLRARHQKGELISPIPRAFTTREIWEKRTKSERLNIIIRTTAIQHPTWIFCSLTAAFILGLTSTYSFHNHVHILTWWRVHSARLPHVRVHSICSGMPEIVEYNNLRITSVERVLMDCARDLDFKDSLPIWDKALRDGMTTRDKMEQFIKEHPRSYGVKAARLLLTYVDERAENGGESTARAVMLVHGYERPQLQISFVNPADGRQIRPDFLWKSADGHMIAGELDGLVKYRDAAMRNGMNVEETLIREKDRETALNNLGIFVTRFQMCDVYNSYELCRKLDASGIPKTDNAEELALRAQLRTLRGRAFNGKRLVDTIVSFKERHCKRKNCKNRE